MPPSPALRCSPGRELRMENNHKRGRSLGSGLPLKFKDDDLALFNDMQTRERDNFLLHVNDDFDDSISKLKYFSDFKLNIPVRGESSDLLNVDGERNDYDWLLTPPDTPLFPSLDDDEPPVVNLVSRGRSRTQPISISRSSTTENSRRTSRTSASPHRLTPSPRSGSSILQPRGRASSAPLFSPNPILRPTTPSHRPLSLIKPLTPTPRSSSPTLRSASTGSSGQASSSGRRGTSPVKTSRGNSASPKLRGWQSNLPGFSSDPPPNLRTSLSDRPTSHTRGSSPASRNGRDSSSKFGRQSMSPTASRSASSSHSYDRDRFSAQSKCSIASSGDDDGDSLHSVSVGITDHPTPKIKGVFVNTKAMTFSRRPSASSAPKRSFNSAVRHLDQRKTPQNMFRPLLSSVPATTIYAGKANTIHRPMFSRNSSLTTSSNASSEQGASVAPDTEGSDHDRNDLAGEWGKLPDSDAQEEIFMFDKVDEICDDIRHEFRSEEPLNVHGDPYKNMEQKQESEGFEKLASVPLDAAVVLSASESLHAADGHFDVDSFEIVTTCSKCLKSYHVFETNDDKVDVCQECAEKDELILDGLYTAGLLETIPLVTQSTEIHSDFALVIDGPCEDSQLGISATELIEQSSTQTIFGQLQSSFEQLTEVLPNASTVDLVTDGREQHLTDQQIACLKEVVCSPSVSGNKFKRLQSFSSHQSLRIDSPEGTGISLLLLKRSSSTKGPVVQGRAFSATSIVCAEPSYARDNLGTMKGSIRQNSSSASSSIDLSSSRQMEACIQRQSSSRKGDMDYVRNELCLQPQSTEIFLSRNSNNSNENPILTHSGSEEKCDGCAGALQYDSQEETLLVSEGYDDSLVNTEPHNTHFSSSRIIGSMRDKNNFIESCRVMVAFPSELCHTKSIKSENASAADGLNDEDCFSSVRGEDCHQQNARSAGDADMPLDMSTSCAEEDDVIGMINGSLCETDIPEDLIPSSSSAILGPEDDHDNFKGLQTECEASQSTSNIIEASYTLPASTTPEKDVLASSESDNFYHSYSIQEKSTVMVEGPGGYKSRSLTLEEATDTILFCSSIVHDLAYKAATIGMEKEHPPPTEASQPTVMILGKSLSDQNNQKKTSSKRTPKPQKAKRERLEVDAKLPSTETGNNLKNHEFSTYNPELSNKIDSTKPPKLESKCNCTVM